MSIKLAKNRFQQQIEQIELEPGFPPMKKSLFLVSWMMVSMPSAFADSCYDLWFERNQIYAENGYCFKTQLGRDTFGNEGCFTNSPKLSKFEARDVKEIKQEEKRRGCKVN